MNDIKRLIQHLQNLQNCARELRNTVAALEHLCSANSVSNETPAAAKRIAKDLGKKHHSYNGKHWTQQPKNKARLRKILQDASAARKAAKA